MTPDQVSAVSERLDAFVRQRMQEENIPSVVLALTDRQQLLHVSAHGYADLAARRSTTESTLYEIGSIGKSFTAIALLQIKDEGKIDLHAPLTDILPWFSVQSEYSQITVHHLLSHSAGIIRGTDFSPDPRFEVWALRDTCTSHPPGEHFHYSNVGYKALGLALERIEGRPYAEIVEERVLRPLGMTNSYGTITHRIRPQMAVGYTRLYDDRPPHRTDPLVPATWFQTNTADGCLATSVVDLATYLRLFLNNGQHGDCNVISHANFDAMTSAMIHPSFDEMQAAYGYGIASGTLDGSRVMGHGGGMVGYVTDMRCLPDYGLGAVVMINGMHDAGEFTTYALRLLSALADGEELPDMPGPRVPTCIANAAEYAGLYTSSKTAIQINAEGDSLLLGIDGDSITLEQRGPDQFYIPHHRHRRYLLSFGRDEHGQIVEAFHGNSRFTSDRYTGVTSVDVPEDLQAFAGEYRSHNPWHAHLCVMLRKGRLVLDHHPDPLEQMAEGVFGFPDNPERWRFDCVVDGKALRLNYSGNDFYRFFTGDE